MSTSVCGGGKGVRRCVVGFDERICYRCSRGHIKRRIRGCVSVYGALEGV